jgi:predicted nuclease with RNAse H fold
VTYEVRVDSVVGVDLSGLSGSTKGRTIGAQIALEERLRVLDTVTIRRGIRGDRDLVDWIDERRPRVIAIDAPLTLPHSVTCATAGCQRCVPGAADYLARDVDRLAAGMPTAMLAAIAFRGIYLARVLRGRGYEVIETYPAAAYRVMGATGKAYDGRAALLADRVGAFQWTIADEVDAVCSALVAADHVTGRHEGVIRGDDGTIWLTAPGGP